MSKPKVVIFAGGTGVRLMEETERLPKPMVRIGQYPMLWHIMKFYSSYGFNEFIILAGYKHEQIKSYFYNYYKDNSDITINLKDETITYHKSHEEDWTITILNTGVETYTGERLRLAYDYLKGERFLLTYGDGLSNVDINKLIEFHNTTMQGSILTLTAVQASGRFGSLNINDNTYKITSFQEKPKNESWINGGFMVVEPEIFNHLYNRDFATILEDLTRQQVVSAYKHDKWWACMDTLKDKYEIEELWKNKIAPWKVW